MAGTPLADVRGVPWGLPEIARLDELQIATLEALHDALLGQGRAQEVVESADRPLPCTPFGSACGRNSCSPYIEQIARLKRCALTLAYAPF